MTKTFHKRNGFLFLSIFFKYVAPILYVLFTFEVFKKTVVDGEGKPLSKYQLSWWVIILIMLVVWGIMYFFKNLSVMVRDMKEGILREFLHGITVLFVPLMLWASANMPAKFLKEFKQFTWAFLTLSLLGLVFEAIYNYYRRRLLLERGYVNVIKS